MQSKRLSFQVCGHSKVMDGKVFLSESCFRLELIGLSICQMLGFDKLSMTFILLRLMIEESNHTVTISKNFIYSILLDCHYILLDVIGGL